ncbi:MAG: hypothetical protein HRU15_05975 [Planctomycetes bacterium]|nr:hypothetical protein [Planctomycetota bacterium]
MIIRALLIITALFICSLDLVYASAAISDGDKIIIYGDGNLSEIWKFTKKEIKDSLKQRKIKIEEKSKKGSSLQALLDGLKKDVIGKKPDMVLLTVPVSDLYDKKTKSIKADADNEKTLATLNKMVEALQSAGIVAAIATPCLTGENCSADKKIDMMINTLSEGIRSYCTENDITCCDYRKTAVKYLSKNNPKKAFKGILTKDGVRINKDGAEILSHALKACLGMSSNGIGGPLTATDRVRFFTSSFALFNSDAGTITKNIHKVMNEKFSQASGPVKPSCKYMPLNDNMYSTKTPSSMINTQRARVSFVYITVPKYLAPDFKKYEATYIKKIQDCCSEIRAGLDGSIFIMTEPAINNAPDDPDHLARIKINTTIRKAALDNGIQIFDLYQMVEDTRKDNANFKILRTLGNFQVFSLECLDLVEKEMMKILGLSN